MFQITTEELARMRSQFVTASRRNVTALLYAFTEQGGAINELVADDQAQKAIPKRRIGFL